MSTWPTDTQMLDWLSEDEGRVLDLLNLLRDGEHSELREALASLMPESQTTRARRMGGKSGR